MADPHCVIRRVRMKSGGADVRILRRNVGDLSPRSALLLNYARKTIEILRGDLTGFVIVAWAADGTNSVSAEIGQDCIPRSLLPAWVAEIVRRDVITASETREIIDSEYVTPAGPPQEPS